MFRPLAVTNSILMVSALFIGTVIIPVLCLFLLKEQKGEKTPFLFGVLLRLYRPLLAWSMKNRLPIVALAIAAFALSIFLSFKMGSEFIPAMDEGSIALNVVRLPSASLAGSIVTQTEIKRLV